jgi:hypothetical protein
MTRHGVSCMIHKPRVSQLRGKYQHPHRRCNVNRSSLKGKYAGCILQQLWYHTQGIHSQGSYNVSRMICPSATLTVRSNLPEVTRHVGDEFLDVTPWQCSGISLHPCSARTGETQHCCVTTPAIFSKPVLFKLFSHIPLSQYKTFTCTTITIQNMYAYTRYCKY